MSNYQHVPPSKSFHNKRGSNLSKTRPEKMYSHDKSIERVRMDKYPVNETMNAFYINKKVLENQEYMRTQKSFMN